MKKRKKFKRENSSAMRAHWTYKRNAHFFLYPPNKCSHNDSTCTDEQREGKKQQQQRTATHRKFPKCNACRTNAIRIWSRIWSTFTCTRKTFSRKYNPLQSSSFSCYLCENEWPKKVCVWVQKADTRLKYVLKCSRRNEFHGNEQYSWKFRQFCTSESQPNYVHLMILCRYSKWFTSIRFTTIVW